MESTGGGTNKLQSSREGRLYHLCAVDASFSLAQVEKGVYRYY